DPAICIFVDFEVAFTGYVFSGSLEYECDCSLRAIWRRLPALFSYPVPDVALWNMEFQAV
ncbi:MAG: hypothetical protein ABIK28_21120, partial [Planctomycetota bacterium]